jgi:hypothetical protein
MAWYDFIFQQGAQTVQNVTAPQPVTPSGQNYTSQPSGQPAPSYSQPAQQSSPQPLSFNPIDYIYGGIQYGSQLVGGAYETIQKNITPQNIVYPLAMTNPLTAPLVVGSTLVSMGQSLFTPQPQPAYSGIGGGAGYTPLLIPVYNEPMNPASLSTRSGYYDPRTLGDPLTQARALELYNKPYLVGTQQPFQSYEGAVLSVLETQRVAAYGTPTLTDDRFFLNELQKGVQGTVEAASAYHYNGVLGGVPVAANPFEYKADLSVELLKGTAGKGFSPVSGEMLPYLPGGRGLQDYGWELAKGSTEKVLFGQALAYQDAATNLQGPYGALYGGTGARYVNPADLFAQSVYSPVRAGSPLVGLSAPSQRNWLEQANYDIGGFFGFRASGLEQTPRGLPKPFLSSVPDSQKSNTIALLDQPGPVAQATNLALMATNFARSGDLGQAYKDIEFTLAAGLTHAWMPSAKGFGKFIESNDTSQSPIGFAVTGAAYGAEAIYTDIREYPLQDIALVALPGAFKLTESAITNTVARGAASKYAIANIPGRALSTPAAKTGSALFKVGIAGLFAYQSGSNIMAAPNTPEGKGTAIGNVAYQVGMMGAGIPLAKEFTPVMRSNPYAGKTFFTGERKLSLSEKTMIRAGDFVNSLGQTKGQKNAIKSISTEYGDKSFIKPENVITEPDIGRLSHVTPSDIPNIRRAALEQPSVAYGSGTIENQLGTGPAAMRYRKNALPSADFDVFTENKAMMEATAGKSASVMDIHTFPEGYVDVGQKANTPSEPGTYLFGNRYQVNPYIDEITLKGKTKGYMGEIQFEQANVQFRKLSSAVRDDISDPMNSGYRLPKDVSRLTRLGDVLEEVRTSHGGKPGTNSFNEMLKQTITYNEQVGKEGSPNIRTDTLFNIRARYEGGRLGEVLDPIVKPYSKGAVSSIASVPFIASTMFVRSPPVSNIFSGGSPVVSNPSKISSPERSLSSSTRTPQTPSPYKSPSPFKSQGISLVPYRSSIASLPLSKSPSFSPSQYREPYSTSSIPKYPGSSISSPPYPSGSVPKYPSYNPPSNPSTPLVPTNTLSPSPPPSAPPYYPPTSPPYTPTITPPTPPTPPLPPTPPPFIPQGNFGGGTSQQPFGTGRWTKWARTNPVADIPYLSKGMGSPWAGKKGKKKGKSAYTGFGNFGKNPF